VVSAIWSAGQAMVGGVVSTGKVLPELAL